MYERFAQLMQERGVTPYRVSMDTGVSQSALSGWKNTGRTPQLRTIKAIADYFGVSVAWLKGETDERGQKETPGSEAGRGISDDELMFGLWGDSDDVDEEDLADVKRYAQFVRERKKDKGK